VRACPYCFAKEHMDTSAMKELCWEDLIYIADFLEISNERKVALLGGEPTIHPQFVDYTTYLLERNFHVNVFTSGILSSDKLAEAQQFLGKYPIERLTFTCNLNHPDISTEAEIKRIDEFLSVFGHVTSLGFNIYQTDINLQFLIGKINEFNLGRHIRFGLAHPIPGEVNQYIPLEKLHDMARTFVSHFDLFEQHNITPGFDCGMPMCIFSDEEIGRLFKLNRGMVSFGCGPAIDIGPDMMVWSCFPLSGLHKKSIYDFNSVHEIGNYFRNLHSKIRAEEGGLFNECDTCKHRANELCKGGCVAHILNRLDKEAMARINELCP